jgi:hypothetical protein
VLVPASVIGPGFGATTLRISARPGAEVTSSDVTEAIRQGWSVLYFFRGGAGGQPVAVFGKS